MRSRLVLALCLVVGMASAHAAEKTVLQRTRGTATTTLGDGQVISGSAEWITGINLTCSATACTGAIYDTDETTDAPTNALLLFEMPAAANASTYVNFIGAPIRATTGVRAYLDTNALSITVYTEQSTP